MKLVWKLLRENISKPQLIGFFLANVVGMSIVLLAVQFYFDISPIFGEKDTLFKKDYITVTKKIGLLSGLSSKSTGFAPAEIEDMEKQSFVKDVGAFIPSQYSVFAGIRNKGGVGFNTQMFFESIPDKFIDVNSKDWHFTEGDNSVPIILPKDYLDLYNFGFAEANSMPKITEGLIGMVSLDISVVGKNKEYKELTGRIVGFSSRINTILVPESFMSWANQTLGGNRNVSPSRLMIEVSNIADPDLSNYFQEKGYEVSGDNTTASKMSFFLKVIVTIVISVGIVICVLSFFILMLSIYLLLEKNMSKLRTLRLIGYSKSYVVKPYEILVLILNSIILLISFVIVFVARYKYLDAVKKIYVIDDAVFPLYTVIIGISIYILLNLLNLLVIRKKVK